MGKNYKLKLMNDGYFVQPKFKDMFKKLDGAGLIDFDKDEFVNQVLNDYVSCFGSVTRRPVSFGLSKKKGISTEQAYKIKRYEEKKIEWLADKKNWPRLVELNKAYLEYVFGEDALTRYGISNSYKMGDLPDASTARNAENFVFMHSDKFHNAIKNCIKIPIEPWRESTNPSGKRIESRKVLMNIDGEILLGEISAEENHSDDYYAEFAGSCVKFCVYYRGLKEGKFNVERWDFEPMHSHPNKFTKNGEYNPNGVFVPKTMHSHIHDYTLSQRLIMTQNSSPDIKCTPINKNKEQEETPYKSFNRMKKAVVKNYNILGMQIEEYDLVHYGVKSAGEAICPRYDSSKQMTVSIPNDFRKYVEYTMPDYKDNLEILEDEVVFARKQSKHVVNEYGLEK